VKYLSVCSGIEAASAAWHPLGWEPVAFSEVEPFPSAVLAHHYPNTPNWGDMTKFQEWPDADVNVLVGGTPCQSFSIAGLRKGMADPRGNLALTFLAIAAKYSPSYIVWENVPGVLSSNGGRDFGAFLAGLGQCGYGWAYRVLDAQYFGVAQRRRRVFVVGHLGDWRRAAAVLFERHSLSGHPAPSRKAGEEVAVSPTIRAGGNRPPGTDVDTCDSLIVASTGQISHCLNAGGMGRQDYETETLVTHARPIVFDTTQITSAANFSNRRPGEACHPLAAGAHAPAVAFEWQRGATQNLEMCGEFSPPLIKSQTPAVAWSIMPMNSGKDFKARPTDVAQPIMAGGPVGGNQGSDYIAGSAVRRLTPRECERLQGFPDDYTLVPHRGKPAADGPRYKALGNSMAVPVMRWIGERIQMVEALSDAMMQEAA
jgi:DNA (cytosine-5)-methyltransferase 1